MPANTEILASASVAEMLGCTEEQVELLARQRQLPGLKFGRGWIFPAGALLHVLNQRAIQEMSAPVELDPAEHPASAARAAVVPVGVEMAPRNRRQTPPTLAVVPPAPELA